MEYSGFKWLIYVTRPLRDSTNIISWACFSFKYENNQISLLTFMNYKTWTMKHDFSKFMFLTWSIKLNENASWLCEHGIYACMAGKIIFMQLETKEESSINTNCIELALIRSWTVNCMIFSPSHKMRLYFVFCLISDVYLCISLGTDL